MAKRRKQSQKPTHNPDFWFKAADSVARIIEAVALLVGKFWT